MNNGLFCSCGYEFTGVIPRACPRCQKSTFHCSERVPAGVSTGTSRQAATTIRCAEATSCPPGDYIYRGSHSPEHELVAALAESSKLLKAIRREHERNEDGLDYRVSGLVSDYEHALERLRMALERV